MSAPRLVVVHRRTQLAELLAEHSTMAAVEFFLETRGQRTEPLVAADEAQNIALAAATNAVPVEWRQAIVERAQLSRFLFEPDDVVVVVGQDGLVPNVAKYLDAQLVFGVSPGAPGLLCPHGVAELKPFFGGTAEFAVGERQMVEAQVDDGQSLIALNEIFVGDRGHQSARYRIEVGERDEMQSSSGLIVGTGTGATGWLASLWAQSRPRFTLPAPGSADLAYFVREAWPSPSTGTSLVAGLIEPDGEVRLRSQSSLVAFGDGIERDHLRIEWGQEVTLRRSKRTLRLATISR
ncbi:NAD kinase [Ruaniaceae bacterium KH17]|nr:NAD kinase [Ruaniaceae bacterium KH17]